MSASRAPSSSALRVEVVSDLARFELLRERWDALLERSVERCATMTHAWTRCWWKSFHGQRALRVMLIWEAEELRCAVALGLRTERRGGRDVRILSTLTNSWVDRTGILIARGDDAALAALITALASESAGWDVLELHDRAVDSPIGPRLKSLLCSHGLLVASDEALGSPYAVLPRSWEEALAALSPSFRQTLRRKLRVATAKPGLEMRIVRDASVIEPIMVISLETWQHENGTSMASTPEVRRFYEQLIAACAESGTLFAALLLLEGEPVAFEFNVLCARTLHNFKLGYRNTQADWSPGLVLKAYTMQRYLEEFGRGDANLEYDFMGTDEPYKQNWTADVRAHECVKGFRPTLRNRLAVALRYKLKPAIRDRFPRAVRFGKRLLKGGL